MQGAFESLRSKVENKYRFNVAPMVFILRRIEERALRQEMWLALPPGGRRRRGSIWVFLQYEGILTPVIRRGNCTACRCPGHYIIPGGNVLVRIKDARIRGKTLRENRL